MFSSYIYPLAIKNEQILCIHRYEKYRPDLSDISDPINTFFHTFLYQTSVVLITASTKAVTAITHSKKLKLDIES